MIEGGRDEEVEQKGVGYSSAQRNSADGELDKDGELGKRRSGGSKRRGSKRTSKTSKRGSGEEEEKREDKDSSEEFNFKERKGALKKRGSRVSGDGVRESFGQRNEMAVETAATKEGENEGAEDPDRTVSDLGKLKKVRMRSIDMAGGVFAATGPQLTCTSRPSYSSSPSRS